MGAAQVAGIDGGDGFGGQGLADPLGLPAAGVVQADVGLALDAGIDVPGGFAMAHGDDAGGFHWC